MPLIYRKIYVCVKKKIISAEIKKIIIIDILQNNLKAVYNF